PCYQDDRFLAAWFLPGGSKWGSKAEGDQRGRNDLTPAASVVALATAGPAPRRGHPRRLQVARRQRLVDDPLQPPLIPYQHLAPSQQRVARVTAVRRRAFRRLDMWAVFTPPMIGPRPGAAGWGGACAASDRGGRGPAWASGPGRGRSPRSSG